MSKIKNLVKYIVYRSPLMRFFGPHYPLKIDPAQMAFIIDAISQTKQVGGSILEIGVAKGDTSVFILEHLRTTNDTRKPLFIDTFSGFTDDSIQHEVTVRHKSSSPYSAFRYGSETVFRKSLKQQGYTEFSIIAGDAAKVDYEIIGPISVVFLDIDVYLPTKAVLEKVWKQLTSPGFILIDDCQPENEWDGSLQAYEEFIRDHNLPRKIAGTKGGIIQKC